MAPQTARELERQWKIDPRWTGVERTYLRYSDIQGR